MHHCFHIHTSKSCLIKQRNKSRELRQSMSKISKLFYIFLGFLTMSSLTCYPTLPCLSSLRLSGMVTWQTYSMTSRADRQRGDSVRILFQSHRSTDDLNGDMITRELIKSKTLLLLKIIRPWCNCHMYQHHAFARDDIAQTPFLHWSRLKSENQQILTSVSKCFGNFDQNTNTKAIHLLTMKWPKYPCKSTF